MSTSDRPSRRPLFLVLEGIDGSGKTTQQRLLADWVRDQGESVTCCRDPGDTPLGQQLREILLHSAGDLHPMSEALLFLAARAELIRQVIRPAQERGDWVVCDRFLLSTVVYQGHAASERIDPNWLWSVGRDAAFGLMPDLILLLDLPVEVASQRSRRQDRFEARGREFQERVRRGFLIEADRQPEKIRIVDALGRPDEVHRRIRDEVERVLERHPRA